MDRRGPGERCGAAQAADVPLVEDDEEDEEDAATEEEAGDFASDPVDDDDESEPDAFAEDDADVLLDEEPRLSFR